jgi:DNA-binding MarR family transcriptional regulator
VTHLRSAIAPILSRHHLTTTQWIVLNQLSSAGTQRVIDLADYMAVEIPTVTMAVRPLTVRELLTSAGRTRDRREKHLEITPAGQHVIGLVDVELSQKQSEVKP